MSLTRDDVKKVAKLANLPVTDEEVELYSSQLSKTLEYIALLNSVDTKDVKPTFNITGLTNVMRPDEVGESLSQEQALQNSKNKHGFFVAKGVFEER
jgi:aspartyl-tRNA(Asn)/glutamyl-tRNA(Gln) amidotransferase subunit C